MQSYDLIAHLKRQRAFSRATFGPGIRTKGVCDHIRKELVEVESDPTDLTEWADVVLLALDGFQRCAAMTNTPIEIAVGVIEAKQSKNECRDWPDWRNADPDKAIEHTRGPSDTHTSSGTPRVPRTPSEGCPYVTCPSPYICKSDCKVSASERGHIVTGGHR